MVLTLDGARAEWGTQRSARANNILLGRFGSGHYYMWIYVIRVMYLVFVWLCRVATCECSNMKRIFQARCVAIKSQRQLSKLPFWASSFLALGLMKLTEMSGERLPGLSGIVIRSYAGHAAFRIFLPPATHPQRLDFTMLLWRKTILLEILSGVFWTLMIDFCILVHSWQIVAPPATDPGETKELMPWAWWSKQKVWLSLCIWGEIPRMPDFCTQLYVLHCFSEPNVWAVLRFPILCNQELLAGMQSTASTSLKWTVLLGQQV